MKLYTFELRQQARLGAEFQGQLVDLAVAFNALTSSQPDRAGKSGSLRAIPCEMISFIRLGKLALDAAEETLAYLKKRPAVPVGEQLLYPFDAVKILAPLTRPGKILCVSNASATPDKEGTWRTDETAIFCKLPNTVVGPGDEIRKPSDTSSVFCEARLGVAIGKRMKTADPTEAMAAIFGYTLLNDLSVSDVTSTLLARNADTFCPIGPCIVTGPLEKSPVLLRLAVNDRAAEESVFEVSTELIARSLSILSNTLTLEPGDVVAFGVTGERSSVSLQEGYSVSIAVPEIGDLRNRLIA